MQVRNSRVYVEDSAPAVATAPRGAPRHSGSQSCDMGTGAIVASLELTLSYTVHLLLYAFIILLLTAYFVYLYQFVTHTIYKVVQ